MAMLPKEAVPRANLKCHSKGCCLIPTLQAAQGQGQLGSWSDPALWCWTWCLPCSNRKNQENNKLLHLRKHRISSIPKPIWRKKCWFLGKVYLLPIFLTSWMGFRTKMFAKQSPESVLFSQFF